TLRGAIISTGVGALVVALGSLVAFFTSTERGAQQLRVIMAFLGGVMGQITDTAVQLGERLFEAINNPKQALDDLGDAFSYYFTEFIPNAINKVLQGFGLLGKAVKQVFAGEFEKALDTAIEGAKVLGDG